MFIIPILAAVGIAFLAASFAKNIKPAVTRTAPLTPGRVYNLIVKNDQPGAPLLPPMAFASIVASGAFSTASGEGAAEVRYSSGTLAPDGGSYNFMFDWLGPDQGVFAWDSAFYIEDAGAVIFD